MQILFGTMFFLGAATLFAGFLFVIIHLFYKKERKRRALLIASLGGAIALCGVIGGVATSNPTASHKSTINKAEAKAIEADPVTKRQTPFSSEVPSNSEIQLPASEDSGIVSDDNQITVKEVASPSDQAEIASETLPKDARQDELNDYMYDNFGGGGDEKYAASWYKSIQSFTIQPEGDAKVIIVNTTLYHDDEGKKFAEQITPAFLGWANSKDGDSSIRSVIINSQSQKPLLNKNNPLYRY